jgi:hypothetical protein
MKKHTLKSLIEEKQLQKETPVMSQEKLEEMVQASVHTQVIQYEPGYLLFNYLGRKMMVLSDVPHDRMRIVSPITKYSTLAPSIKDSLMQSNFHSALDARYAVSEDTLYAAFIHPLSTLAPTDLESALRQVFNLAATFGKTYSSGQLEFTHKK